MATELTQGANLKLPPTSEVLIDIRWEPERPAGQEVDASAFLLGAGGKVGGDCDFVFYDQLQSPCGGVTLVEGAGAHRRFRIRPGALPGEVAKVAVCLTLYGGVSFAQARSVEVKLGDPAGNTVAVFRPAMAGRQEAALILCEIYRHQGQWKLRAVAQGFAGGLGALARYFGVEIGSDAETDAAPPQPPSQSPASARTEPGPANVPPTGALPTGSRTERSASANLTYEILYPGTYALARVDLPQGRQLKAQSDAMVAMSSTLDVEGRMQGGVLGGLGRMVTGESLFLQTLTAKRGDGSVCFAPASPGDVAAIEVQPGDGLVIANGNFLACTEGIEVNSRMQNIAQGLFSGAGLFVLKAQGVGLVFVEAFGAVHRISLGAGEQRIVDNGHLVAWSESMHYNLELGNRGLLASFTSGENIVCRFHGPGTVLVQSRQPRQFGRWLWNLLPH
jgi:uncharacterized protein (TIGR00266 family)